MGKAIFQLSLLLEKNVFQRLKEGMTFEVLLQSVLNIFVLKKSQVTE